MIEFQEKPLKKGLIREKENSLSHKAFGCWVKGRQLHRVGQRRPHFRQNSFVRDKLLFPVNAALINLRRRKLFWFGVYCMMGWILNHPPHQPEGRVFSPKQTGSPLALTFCSELDLRDIKTGPVNHPDPPPQKTLPDALGGFQHLPGFRGWWRTGQWGDTLPCMTPELGAAPPPAAPSPSPHSGSRGRPLHPAPLWTGWWCCSTALESALQLGMAPQRSPRHLKSSDVEKSQMRGSWKTGRFVEVMEVTYRQRPLRATAEKDVFRVGLNASISSAYEFRHSLDYFW